MNVCDNCNEIFDERKIHLTQDENNKITWLCDDCLNKKNDE